MASITTGANLRVENNATLIVNFNNADSQLDLNTILGNDNGRFSWGSGGFLGSAQNVSFSVEGAGVPVFRAQLKNANGDFVPADVNLDERIKYDGSNVVFQQ
ncbi:hypothetical protein G7Y89_g14185 [Cudoniella acicularis]|uniref:Cyanovirin-N domain-containing protein n=1 Tax=Cudoniella acicularis TaxID=354080 RepID=A0A8H4R8B3_9HELO|nr:hypothetical protein G7Y89_g14185 [Cudoniella acicularis]